MDKYEYKVRAEEIKDLIARGEYPQAAEIADTIDWRRVKSVMMLCTISDLYKINRRYEDAKNMLLLAYERRPGGRTICYSLCELTVKTGDIKGALDYYLEYVQAAPPDDTGRYILQYKIYEAQEVSLEERIGVLEELKKRDYREKWAYELAYLYHRVGLATRCVEECDELILWFGDGKYVIKAMELKMLHQPLTPAQQDKYDRRFETYDSQMQAAQNVSAQEQDSFYQETGYEVEQSAEAAETNAQTDYEARAMQGDTLVYENIRRAAQTQAKLTEQGENAGGDAGQPEEMDIQVKIMDVGKYNTMNLPSMLVEAGLQEVLGEEQSKAEAITRSIVAPMMDTESLDYPELEDEDISENDVDDGVEQIESTEVFFGETGELGTFHSGAQPEPDMKEIVPELERADIPSQDEVELETEQFEFSAAEASESEAEEQETVEETPVLREVGEAVEPATVTEPEPEDEVKDETAEIVMNQLRMENAGKAVEQALMAQPPKELAGVLSQESDGQISLVIPEREVVEKQITGQMSIADILSEWERLKQESQERREAEVRQRVLQQTGEMFTEFEASVRDGLLEQLESGAVDGEPVEETEEEPENLEDLDVSAELEDTGDVAEEVIEGAVEETVADAEAADVGLEDASESFEAGEGDSEYGEAEIGDIEEQDAEAADELAEDAEESGDLEEPEDIEGAVEEAEEESAKELATDWVEVPLEEEHPVEADIESEEAADNEDEATEADNIDVQEQNSDEAKEPEKTPDAALADEEEQPVVERETAKVRALTQEEKELFAPYIQSKAAKEQLVKAIDNISLAAYTGNIIITGDEGMDTATLAKNLIRDVQLTDSNFSGKVAKISGQALNKKKVAETLGQLRNGALIIQKASGMSQETACALHKELQRESLGIIIVMEDTKKAANKFLEANKELAACFTARVNVEALSNDMLVAFGKQYAKGMEYSIDELGVLALHTRIEELQTIDHAVTVLEVKGIVDEAIHHANRKTLGHFVDVLLAKRYDEEDMIILTEKDFA